MNGKEISSVLTVVGVGIKFYAQLTVESIAHIKSASKLLYLVNNSETKEWLQEANQSAESLDPIYLKYQVRQDAYEAITDYILELVDKHRSVCVVIYGHPCVFASPGLNAVKKAKKAGISAYILPAISAEDCLFADLLVDPGSVGCCSYEASDLLLYQRSISADSHLIIWQVGFIGVLGLPNSKKNVCGIKMLTEYLLQYYPSEHEIILYEAPQLPGFDAIIVKLQLYDLHEAKLNAKSSLYIPPTIKKEYNSKIAKLFKL